MEVILQNVDSMNSVENCSVTTKIMNDFRLQSWVSFWILLCCFVISFPSELVKTSTFYIILSIFIYFWFLWGCTSTTFQTSCLSSISLVIFIIVKNQRSRCKRIWVERWRWKIKARLDGTATRSNSLKMPHYVWVQEMFERLLM